MKNLRNMINQTAEMTALDEKRARDQLKEMKKADYDAFMGNKRQNEELSKLQDREYINGQVQRDNDKISAEKARQDEMKDILKNALINQVLEKNQRATAASLRFPDVFL